MATLLKSDMPIARKEHRCSFCNGAIKAGERYAHTVHADGGIIEQKFHLGCQEAIMEYTDPYDDDYSVAGVMEGVNDALREAGIKPASWVQDAVQQWTELRYRTKKDDKIPNL